jgi:endonuclease/exonuclease/phosphatase family metal-dependent hydrolase
MKDEKECPWILVGDFNDWNKKITSRIENALSSKEVFKALHGKCPRTFPSFLPTLSLDRIFIHKLAAIKAVALREAHWRNLSDHLPLYVEIDLST